MAATIAEAFVRIRPDLRGFTQALRTDLDNQIKQVAARKVAVVPDAKGFARGARTAIDAQLKNLTARPVEVRPVLTRTAKADLTAQLGAVGPVPFRVAPELTALPAAQLRQATAGIQPVEVPMMWLPPSTAETSAVTAQIEQQVNETTRRKREQQSRGAGGGAAGKAADETEALTALQKQQQDVVRDLAEAQQLANVRMTESVDIQEASNAASKAVGSAKRFERNETVQADAALRQQAEAYTQSAVAAKKSVQANRDLNTATAATARVNQAGATAVGELTKLKAQLDAANAAVTRSETAVRAASLSGTQALVAEADALLVANKATRDKLADDFLSLKAKEEQLPITEALSAAETELAAARAATGRTAIETQDERARAAKRGITAATRVENDARKQGLVLMRERATALRIELERELEAAGGARKLAAAQRDQTRASGQAQRGALATTAGFAGLRGAVLAASGPFLAATIAVTALGKAVSSASGLQGSMNTLQAVTQATDEQMSQMSSTAEQLGADLTLPSVSASDAATSMTELSKAGLSVNDTLDATRGVLELAVAANIDFGESAKIVASQLNAFQLEGSKAVEVADLLAGASIAAQGEITDFAIAFQQASAVAAQTGVSIETTTALLVELAKAGLRGSDAGTSLRTFLLRLLPASKDAAEAMRFLGVELDDTRTIGEQLPSVIEDYRRGLLRLNETARVSTLREIFGQDAIRAASIIFRQQPRELQRLTAALSEGGFAAQISAARMKGLAGAIEGLKSQGSTLGTNFAQLLLPALEGTARAMADITSTANNALETLKPLAAVARVLSSAVGGGDAVAQIALSVTAALGLRKLVEHRRAQRIATEQARAAIQEEAAVSVESAAVQTTSVKTVTTTLEAQLPAHSAIQSAYAKDAAAAQASSRSQILGAKMTTAAVVEAAATRSKGILRENKLLIASLAAAVVGSQLEQAGGTVGEIGGAVSTVGTFALAGSVFGPAGTIVGAGIGGAIAGINKAAQEKRKVQAEWDSKTASEQFMYLSKIGRDRGRAFLEIFDLRVKPFKTKAFDFSLDAMFKRASAGFRERQQPLDIFKTAPIRPLNIDQSINLAIAEAKSDRNVDALTKALVEQATRQDKKLGNLWEKLRSGVGNRKKIADQIIEAISDRQAILDAIAQAATMETRRDVQIQIQATRAQRTDTLSDDIAAARDAVNEAQKRLANAAKTKDAIDAATLALENAKNDLAALEQQQLENDKQDAEDRKQRADDAAQLREDQLRFFADQAGNIGRHERNLIAFLRRRVAEAKGNARELFDARRALSAEIENQRQALDEAAELSVDLQMARIDTRLARAQAADSIAGQVAAERARKRLLEVQLKNTLAEAAQLKKNSAAWKQKQREAENLRQQIIATNQTIKDLTNEAAGGGGFTLQELFQEAIGQFTEFGSNIGPIGTPLSPQDARGAFSLNVLRTGARDPSSARAVAEAIASGEAAQANRDGLSLAEQRRQSAILDEILRTARATIARSGRGRDGDQGGSGGHQEPKLSARFLHGV